ALNAAVQVLEETKKAMSCPELIEVMAEKGYWTSPGGKTPAATLYSALLRELKTKGKDARFKKTERGKVARGWTWGRGNCPDPEGRGEGRHAPVFPTEDTLPEGNAGADRHQGVNHGRNIATTPGRAARHDLPRPAAICPGLRRRPPQPAHRLRRPGP